MDISENILTVLDLCVKHLTREGEELLLDHINLSIKKGTVLGITGQSGSGKSMTSLSIMGLTFLMDDIEVTGKVIFEGQDLLSKSEKEWQKIRGLKISMVFQSPEASLNPVIRCGEQVIEAIRTHHPEESKKSARLRAAEVLVEVGLMDTDKIFKAYPHELSGGQIQRVMIAMAIANRPDIIIADEPTSSLDIKSSREIVKTLLELKNKYQCALIFITHDLYLLKQISDTILFLKDGRTIDFIDNSDLGFQKLSPTARDYFEEALTKLPFRLLAKKETENCVLEGRNLAKRFNERNWFSLVKKSSEWVINNITFCLCKGQILGILGVSGSGKTTIAKILAGVIEPTSGEMYFQGLPITRHSFNTDKQLRKTVQIIFQDALTSLNPKMTVGQQIIELLMFHKIAKDAHLAKAMVDSVLLQLNLHTDVLKKYPAQLSGGQRQRLILVRTLLLKPEVIIFDESLSALDVINQHQIIEYIVALQHKFDFCGVFISHDPELIKAVCTDVVILDKGQIAEAGKTEVVFTNPEKAITKELLLLD